MKRRIENSLSIICDDVDLETISNIEFYVRQGRFFRQYVTEVISSNEMLVRIPFEDAKVMTTAPVQLQFAFVDANGNPRSTEIAETSVGDLLKEAGYDPV